MKNMKSKIRTRIAQAMQSGMTIERASFEARQWARHAAAKERLTAKAEEEANGDKDATKQETISEIKTKKPRGRPARGTRA